MCLPYLSVALINLSASLSVRMSVYPSLCLFVHLPGYPSIYRLSLYPSMYLPIHPCMSLAMSVHGV